MDISSNTQATFAGANNYDVSFGAGPAGIGGTITLASNVRVGGKLIFAPVAGDYTIGDGTNTYSLTVAAGIESDAVAPVINAPVVLETNTSVTGQTITVSFNGR